jgi:hypothetical protein
VAQRGRGASTTCSCELRGDQTLGVGPTGTISNTYNPRNDLVGVQGPSTSLSYPGGSSELDAYDGVGNRPVITGTLALTATGALSTTVTTKFRPDLRDRWRGTRPAVRAEGRGARIAGSRPWSPVRTIGGVCYTTLASCLTSASTALGILPQ